MQFLKSFSCKFQIPLDVSLQNKTFLNGEKCLMPFPLVIKDE